MRMITPAPNFTKTPNDLFDHWLPHLGEAELKVLLVVMRKTFGWQKIRDQISISQLAKITGMERETVIKAARSLQKKGVIKRDVVGKIGKQETYYELVIDEDSNNSYPSAEPTGPVGFNPLVQSDSQKKPCLKETNTKEQQQAAAVFSEKPKEKQPSGNSGQLKENPKIYECLKQIDIPENDKCQITARHEESIVKNGVAWATHAKNPPSKCLAASIKYACKNSLSSHEFDKEKEKSQTPYEKLNKIFKNGEKYNQAECVLKTECIAFERGMKSEHIKLDKYFTWDKLESLCASFGILIPRTT